MHQIYLTLVYSLSWTTLKAEGSSAKGWGFKADDDDDENA